MIFGKTRRSVLIASVGSILCGFSHAQERGNDQIEELVVTGAREVALDTRTSTGSRLGLSQRETPAIVDVLGQERLLERGLRTTNEALNSAAGVTAVDTGGSPGTVSMRGFSGNAVSVNYDGVHQPSTMVTRNYDTFAFDRIEVLKGPASVLYGEGALGGAVNFVPKKPFTDGRRWQVLVQRGGFDTYRAAFDANVPLTDRLALRGIFSRAGSDGYIDDTVTRTTTANLGVLHEPSSNLTSFINVEYFENDNTATYWGTPVVPFDVAREPADVLVSTNGFVVDKALRRANFQYADATVKSDQLWVRWGIDWRLNDTWSFVNDLSYNEGDRLWHDAESYSYVVATGDVDRRPVHIRNLLSFWNERVMLSADSLVAGRRNRFLMGVEHSENDHLSIRRFGASTPVDPYKLARGVFPEINETNFPGATNFSDVGSLIKTNAMFLENAFDLSDRLLLVAGARYEEMDLDRTIDDHNLGTAVQFDRLYRQFSFRIGGVFDLTDRTHLYAQYNEAAAPVSTLVLLSEANSTFDLTQGASAEVGVKSSFWDDRAEVTLAAYRIRQTDIITRDPLNPNIAVQGGMQSSRGIELSGSVSLTRQLRLDINYAALEARFDELIEAGGADRSGNRPSNTPDHIFNLFASYRLARVPLRFTAGARHSGEVFADNANTVRVDGYTVVDASIGYAFPFGDLTLRGRNLGNELYVERAGRSAVYLGTPRSVDLTFQARF